MAQKKAVDLLSTNKEYQDAFHNYFYLVGMGKKKDAIQYKKIMVQLENEYTK